MNSAQATRILAIRHGETLWNVDSRIQGHLDIGLNDTGRWQAERLGLALKDEPIAAIYASDLSRAHDTALAVSRHTDVPVRPEPGLRERSFGEFEGRTFAEIETELPAQAQRWLGTTELLLDLAASTGRVVGVKIEEVAEGREKLRQTFGIMTPESHPRVNRGRESPAGIPAWLEGLCARLWEEFREALQPVASRAGYE